MADRTQFQARGRRNAGCRAHIIGPPDTVAVEADLRRKFSASDLIDVGLMVQDGDASPVWAPAVSASNTVCLAWSTAGGGEHDVDRDVDGMSSHKSLAARSDHVGPPSRNRPCAADQGAGVDRDLEDTILLRRLGIPASPLMGITTLSAANLQFFCERVGIHLDDHDLQSLANPDDLWGCKVGEQLDFLSDCDRGGLE